MLAESGFFYVICGVGYQMYKRRPCHPGDLTHPLHAAPCDTASAALSPAAIKTYTLLLLTAVLLKCVSGSRNDSLTAATE